MPRGNEMAAPNQRELEEVKRQENLRAVKNLLNRGSVKERFNAILGKKSAQFMASLVNVVSGSAKLLDCDPNSVMAAAFVAATYDLPIDGNLGFAAIVPYKNSAKDPATGQWTKVSVAQFQMMYKGFVQLAIRSHEYQKINCSDVYEDEFVGYNPITGECQFVNDFSQCSQRAKGEFGRIVGYYAWFRLHSGYTAELYMSRAEVEYHARKYSKSYQNDLRFGRQTSLWSSNFDAMARKTVLKQLLSRWGILSIDVQRAIQDDQKVYDASGESSYADSQGEFIAAEDPFTVEGQVVEDTPEGAAVEETPQPPENGKPHATENPPTEAASDDTQKPAGDEPEEVDITQL